MSTIGTIGGSHTKTTRLWLATWALAWTLTGLRPRRRRWTR